MKIASHLTVLSILILMNLTGCTAKPTESISILSGQENKVLEPFIKEFEKMHRTRIDINYRDTVDIMLDLRRGDISYDAVWPADSLWLSLGTADTQVKYLSSIMTSPIVIGMRKSLAEHLGWVGKDVYVRDILKAIREDDFSFFMASATQTNSGVSTYMGFLNALAGNPAALTMDNLLSDELKTDMRDLLGGVRRLSGSSEWLKDLFLESDYDAMVNYEYLIIETNRELIAQGREPLYIVYPADSIICADSPLGYIDRNYKEKEETFLKLKKFLLSDEIQTRIAGTGRRSFLGNISHNDNTEVFNPAWGISTEPVLQKIQMPSPDVTTEALDLYQTALKKPSLTFFCLDYSASMKENEGIHELKTAMQLLLNQNSAREYMIQAGEDDIIAVLPFSLNIFDMWTAEGNDQEDLDTLFQKIENLRPGGTADIYTPVITAMDILSGIDTLDRYIPAIILMTDGESNKGRTFAHLQKAWETYNVDIPVFSIMFGQADEHQLNQIGELTRGRVFDGKSDLAAAFRKVKGYN